MSRRRLGSKYATARKRAQQGKVTPRYDGAQYFCEWGRGFAKQVRRHMAYHWCKYGRPALVMANPLDAPLLRLDGDFYGCEVKATNSVLPGRVWIGTTVERPAITTQF